MTATFLGSFVAGQDLPESDQPRVAFLGRSNVGKSSLINLITAGKVARVSKTPGRTRMLNLFKVDHLVFGDFPGYGYAKVSKTERKQWEALIERSNVSPVEAAKVADRVLDALNGALDEIYAGCQCTSVN